MTNAKTRMRAIRLHEDRGLDALRLDDVDVPVPAPGEALVRVHAAAITRDELRWPVDRLPATPSYELSGVVEAVAPDVAGIVVGEAVYALTGFDRDGVAADYAVVPASYLAPKPRTLDHVESAAMPMPGLTAWQGLFDHGRLEAGQRVLILGATGGVGRVATQLASRRGAHVVGTASATGLAVARALGAHDVLDRERRSGDDLEPVDLVFDTVGGEELGWSMTVVRGGGHVVSIAEEPPEPARSRTAAAYFVVGQSREQLVEIARLVDDGHLRPAIDSVFALEDARAAFERVAAPGKRGKVVLRVADG